MIIKVALVMNNDQIANYALIKFALNVMKIIFYLKIIVLLNAL